MDPHETARFFAEQANRDIRNCAMCYDEHCKPDLCYIQDCGSDPSSCGDYYVYVWMDRKTFEVFYVGKGKGKRWADIHRSYRFEREVYRRKTAVYFPVYNCSETLAFEIEKWLIENLRANGHPLLNVNHTKGDSCSESICWQYKRFHPERFGIDSKIITGRAK